MAQRIMVGNGYAGFFPGSESTRLLRDIGGSGRGVDTEKGGVSLKYSSEEYNCVRSIMSSLNWDWW